MVACLLEGQGWEDGLHPPDAAAVQLEVLRSLSPVARLEVAFDMSLLARALLRSRLHLEHPELRPRALDLEVLRHALEPAVLPVSPVTFLKQIRGMP